LVAVRAVRFSPGMQLYLDGVSVTKQKDLVSSMLRASGNVNIRMDPRRRVVYYDQSARFRISHPVLQKKDLALKKCSEILRVVVIS